MEFVQHKCKCISHAIFALRSTQICSAHTMMRWNSGSDEKREKISRSVSPRNTERALEETKRRKNTIERQVL